jgi:hypothetical protein
MLIHSKDFVRLISSFLNSYVFILVECKVYFTHEAVSVDSEITLQVALKYNDEFNTIPKTSFFDYLEMVFHYLFNSINC